MLKKSKQLDDSQEIEQEERELKREYFIFIPILVAVVGFMSFALTRPQTRIVVELVPAQGQSGYWLVYDNGDIQSVGTASPTEKIELEKDAKLVGAQAAKSGFWAMSNTGHVYALAGAEYAGGLDDVYKLKQPVELMSLPNGRSYRITAKDGSVYDFNTTPITGGADHSKETAAATSTASGKGYWLIQPKGEITTFGDASYYPNIDTHGEVVVDSSVYGDGVIVLTNKGRIAILGSGSNHGDLSDLTLKSPVVDIDATNDGYRITFADGTVRSFGDARSL